ncbi:MAG: LCP family protein [Lachnospiraceae bacterium]|nr:LCP family protein [Lachnospiraceae bacterium]
MKRFLLLSLLLLSMAAGFYVAKTRHEMDLALNKMNRDESTDLNTIEVNENLVSDDDIITIILVGADKRESEQDRGRSDSLMLATMDTKHKELKLTSIMRDTYLEIPGHGSDRFNAAYSYGGVGLTYQTIAQNFNISANGYVIVDFEGFKKVINKIGGVEMEVTQEEKNVMADDNHYPDWIAKLKIGKNKLNGKQALAYCRMRHDSKGDFGRTERQRNLLSAIFKKMKTMPIPDALKAVQEILPYITTDLSNEEIYAYVAKMITMGTTDIEQLRIPVEGTYAQQRISGKSVLVPDISSNADIMQKFIFESQKELSLTNEE